MSNKYIRIFLLALKIILHILNKYLFKNRERTKEKNIHEYFNTLPISKKNDKHELNATLLYMLYVALESRYFMFY